MTRSKFITVVIGADGRCSVDALNFTGTGCQAAVHEVASALGGQVDSERSKPEARARERQSLGDRESAR